MVTLLEGTAVGAALVGDRVGASLTELAAVGCVLGDCVADDWLCINDSEQLQLR